MSSIKAKKSLGQHFLRSKVALAQIIKAAELTASDTVLEIGPGEGALTEALLESGARVVAVETDARCIEKLNERFATEIDAKRFVLIEGDIREENIQQELFHKKYLGTTKYKLVANIPYYITGYLFRLFLETLRQPTQIIFLVQKEVAQLIVAHDGKEGILSLAVKAYGDPRIVAKVKREAFSPPPKVDSSIIAVENISRDRLAGISNAQYFAIVKAGLGARRKQLFGSLIRALDIPKETLGEVFKEAAVDEKERGEDIPFEKWVALIRALNKKLP